MSEEQARILGLISIIMIFLSLSYTVLSFAGIV
jgi:hypothetical protein